MSTKTYGFMKHEISFDKNNITEIEVDKIADGLTKTTFFDYVKTKYVFVNKEDNTYELSIAVVDDIVDDNQSIQEFIELRNDLQKLFTNNKIVIHLVADFDLDNVIKRLE
jgi:hypothetical protein